MNQEPRRRKTKTFISSQVGYCSLVWLFCSRRRSNHINRIQGRTITIVYNDNSLSIEELLDRGSFVSIHIRNLQVLAGKVCKINNQISPAIMQGHFKTCGSEYSLRRHTLFENTRFFISNARLKLAKN